MKNAKNVIIDFTESIKNRIFEISKDIYENPELGNKEFRSSKLLREELAKFGFEIESPLGSLPTAFKAVKKGRTEKPAIAFLAEYDALPVVGHGCGHNWIGTASTFAGIAAGELIKNYDGEIQVIGTPAEESQGGKIILLEEGYFDNTDFALMAHPSNETVSHYKSLAAQVIDVEFIGKPAHAAASPWLGVNALDALIQSFIAIDNLKKQLSPSFRIPGIIKHGGDRPNVVPERTVGCFSLRTETLNEMEELRKKVNNIFQASALATGCSVKITEAERPYYPMNPNKKLIEIFEETWRDLGGIFINNPLKGYGSLDIGNLSHKFPCFHPSISIIDDIKVAGHTKEFGSATQSEKGKEQLLRTIKTLALMAIKILENRNLSEEIKNEIKSNSK